MCNTYQSINPTTIQEDQNQKYAIPVVILRKLTTIQKDKSILHEELKRCFINSKVRCKTKPNKSALRLVLSRLRVLASCHQYILLLQLEVS